MTVMNKRCLLFERSWLGRISNYPIAVRTPQSRVRHYLQLLDQLPEDSCLHF
jgi:hypothetical protein